MLEEYRVSLWAQQLGTAYPVSDQRIRKALALTLVSATSLDPMTSRPHHRPMTPGGRLLRLHRRRQRPRRGARGGRPRREAARAGRQGTGDDAVVERLVHLAETEGIETIAEVWSGSPADSLAGCLWRLYLLRAWVYAEPVAVARAFEAGRARAQVARVVAGVADPPGPDELKAMVDQVLRGIAGSDLADVLLRAAAFARVVATGRATLPEPARPRCSGCCCSPSSSRPPGTPSSARGLRR